MTESQNTLKPGGTAFIWCGDDEDFYKLGGEVEKVTIDAALPNNKYRIHTTTYHSMMPELEPVCVSFDVSGEKLFGQLCDLLDKRCLLYRNFIQRNLARQDELERLHEEAMNNATSRVS